MACVLIWLVHSTTEELRVDSSALSAGEAIAAQLSTSLATGTVLALLLPNYTVDSPVQRALPACKYNDHYSTTSALDNEGSCAWAVHL